MRQLQRERLICVAGRATILSSSTRLRRTCRKPLAVESAKHQGQLHATPKRSQGAEHRQNLHLEEWHCCARRPMQWICLLLNRMWKSGCHEPRVLSKKKRRNHVPSSPLGSSFTCSARIYAAEQVMAGRMTPTLAVSCSSRPINIRNSVTFALIVLRV